MIELHEMYATLTAKKPELKFDRLDFCWDEDSGGNRYGYFDLDKSGDPIDEVVAAALIRVRWEDALPEFHGLFYAINSDGITHFFVHDHSHCHTYDDSDYVTSYDAVSVLYHFHMRRA